MVREELTLTRNDDMFLNEMDVEVFSRSGMLHLVVGLADLEKVKDDIPDKRTGGPKRAPRTMQAMQKQYPDVVNSGIVPENCYTCMFPLNRFTKKYEDQIVHCYICDEANVHRSCLKNCRICDEKNL